MKINTNYKLREIAGETIIVHQGQSNVNLTRIISLNASAKLLYEKLLGKDFDSHEVATILVDTYGIDQATAEKDAAVWIEKLEQCGVIA